MVYHPAACMKIHWDGLAVIVYIYRNVQHVALVTLTYDLDLH